MTAGREWSDTLSRSPSVSYLKASEVWERNVSKSTPFVHFTNEQRMHKIETLVDVLTKYEPMTASFQLRWSIFADSKGRYPLPKGYDDPYFYLYYGVILLYAGWAEREGNTSPFDFVFDGHNSIGDEVRRWYPTFKNRCPPAITLRLGCDPAFGDEKNVIPLQAADLFAWYARRNILGSLGNNRHEKVWSSLSAHYSAGAIEMEHLISIGEMVGFIRPCLKPNHSAE
jgi:hypothetical protein